jgi:60 kDa SS-A/Ro ribonucleoprotein
VILSDMQGWIGGGAPVQPFADYKTRYSVTPRVFSFDLKGYGTLQFPQERVYCLAGWSDRVFEIMQKLDRDPEALVRDVESVPLED